MRKTTPKKTTKPKARAKAKREPEYPRIETPSEQNALVERILSNVDTNVNRTVDGLEKQLRVRLGQMVAEQVAGLARKADQEAELERLNFFAARAMEALLRLTPRSEFSSGARESITRDAFEMARAMVEHGKTLVKP
jgi:hypothetical protein